MEPKKRDFESRKRYIAAIILGTIAFVLIFAISYSLSYIELQRVSNQQVGVGYDIFKDKLDYSFFNSTVCAQGSLTKISSDLAFQGSIIDDLEKKLGKQNSDVLLRKQFYSLIEVEHLEFILDYNSKCGFKPMNTILFFYSNNASLSDKSNEAGRILDVVSGENPNTLIYSFDVDLNSDVVSQLETKYNVTGVEAPVIVVNGKTKMEMPANIQEIEKHLL